MSFFLLRDYPTHPNKMCDTYFCGNDILTRREKEGEHGVLHLLQHAVWQNLPSHTLRTAGATVWKEKIETKRKKRQKKEQRREWWWQHTDDDTNRGSNNETMHRVLHGGWLRRRADFSRRFSGRHTWHLQLSLRGPWLLRLIRLPERTIGVRCRTLVWIHPSFSNWIRSFSGSHGLVLQRGQRETPAKTGTPPVEELPAYGCNIPEERYWTCENCCWDAVKLH